MAPWVDKPQKRKVERILKMGATADTTWAERETDLLSLSHPKNVDAMIPDVLKRANVRVPAI